MPDGQPITKMKKYKANIQLTIETEDNHGWGSARQFEIDLGRWIGAWWEQFEGCEDDEYVGGSFDLIKVKEMWRDREFIPCDEVILKSEDTQWTSLVPKKE